MATLLPEKELQELMEKSKQMELEASKITGIAPVLGGSVGVSPTITGELIKAPPVLEPVQPKTTPLYPIGSLETPAISGFTPAKLTQEQQQAQDITAQLQELYGKYTGQTLLKAEQEKAFGVPELLKTQTDLTAQLKGYQAELAALEQAAKAIPLQLQEQFAGRGVTVGGLAPIEAGELRKNAIAALGISAKALTTSALLQATQGNLVTANTMVEKAIEQKYGPIKEEIDVKLANLELILKSPAYSLAEKNQAEAQKAIQKKKEEETAKKEQIELDILKIAVEVATTGKATSLQLEQIKNAKNEIEAAQLAAPFLKKEITLPSEIQEFKAFFPKVDITTPAGQQQYLNWKAKMAAVGKAPEKPEPIKLQPSIGFFDPKIESSVREDFVELSGKYKIPNAPTEEEKNATYTTLRNLYSPQEASDEALKQLVGIAEAKPSEEIQADETAQQAASSWLGGVIGGIKGFFGFKETKGAVDLTKEFGKGNFSSISIQQRLNQLLPVYKDTGAFWKEDLKKKLLSDGYSTGAIKALNF